MIKIIIGFFILSFIIGIHYLLYLWLGIIGILAPYLILIALIVLWGIGDVMCRIMDIYD